MKKNNNVINKKRKIIISTIVISFLLLNILSIPSTVSKGKQNNENTRLYAIGIIRINPNESYIDGFVFVGYNGGNQIFFKQIDIKYDGSLLSIINPVPLLFIIDYVPGE